MDPGRDGVATLHTCASGKAIGSLVIVVVDVIVMDTKIGDLGACASCKHNRFVKLGEELASMRLEWSGTA